MIHTSNERYQTAIDALLAAEKNGTIYNVDFKSWRGYANSAYERDVSDKIRSPYFSAGKYEGRTEQERDIEYTISYGLHAFPSQKLQNLLNNHLADLGVTNGQPSAFIQAVMDLITVWKPVSDTIKALRTMVVMGRKPSTDPRKTPERTIENTGTCAVCEMNVKLDKGQHIVAHGYTIRWGFQSGNCHGVRFKAVELSSEGIVSWKGALEAALAHAEENIQSLRDAAEVDKNRTTRMAVSQAEATIKFAPDDIIRLEKKIANWEPKALPGDKK